MWQTPVPTISPGIPSIRPPGNCSPKAPWRRGLDPRSVTVDPTGKYAYVTNYGTCTVLVYTIDPASGALTAAGTIATRSGPMSISIAAGSSAVKYTPKAAYVANAGSNSVSQYTIGTSGALTPDGDGHGTQRERCRAPLPSIPRASSPTSPITVPTMFRHTRSTRSPEPSLRQSVHPLRPALRRPRSASIPSGRFVYVSNYGWPSFGSVSAYTVNASTGALTAIAGSPFAAGNGSSSIDVDPSGRFVYTTNLLNDTITAFSIDPATRCTGRHSGSERYQCPPRFDRRRSDRPFCVCRDGLRNDLGVRYQYRNRIAYAR